MIFFLNLIFYKYFKNNFSLEKTNYILELAEV